MTSVLGVDGCKGGWVAALLDEARGLSWHFSPTFAPLLDLAEVIAVDIPIGLPDTGSRACDREARTRLPGRGSSVFPAPLRCVLEARTYAEARELSVAAHGRSLSAQAFALVAKVREVDAVRDERRVAEAHPEVSFAELLGTVPPQKRTASGALARLDGLTRALGRLPTDVPAQAALDDALDALVCVWTARRWREGRATVLGGDRDSTGQPMRIVV